MPAVGATYKKGPAKRKEEPALTARTGERGLNGGTATVLDRIRDWQNINATEAVDPDVLSVHSQARSYGARTPIPSPSRDVQEGGVRPTARKRSTGWVQQQNKGWVKHRRSTGGDRRQTEARRARCEDPVSKVVVDKDDLPRDLGSRSSEKTQNIASSHAEREERRRRRRKARAKAVDVHDGIRIYAESEHDVTSDFQPDGENQPEEVRDLPSADEDRPEYLSQVSFRHDGPLPGAQDDIDIEHVRPSKYAQTLGQPPSCEIDTSKTRKRAFINKTKEVLTGRSDGSVPKSNRIPSIEAWLEEQPAAVEPFDASNDEPVITPLQSDIPKPLKTRHRRQRLSVEPTEPTIVEVDDPNRIWDAVSRSRPTRERDSAQNAPRQEPETSPPQRRLFSFEVCDDLNKGEKATSQPPDYAAHGEKHASDARARSTKKSSRQRTKREAGDHAPDQSLTPTEIHRQDSIQPDRDISPKKKISSHLDPTTLPVASDTVEIVDKGQDVASSHRLKRKLTTHEDLLSVLSQPRARKSTRSLRTKQQATPDLMTITEAIRNTKEEEAKYTRELRTLVDGVTPVLLQNLLSKTDASIATGMFSDNAADDASFTRPIVDMGVALQRLKNTHRRIPLQDDKIDNLLTWAVTAHKPYSEYIKVWRLGFQDVIVNLAPTDPASAGEDAMLARDLDGDATNDEGEKVDVAYLQKRPLVRVKRLAKLFATIRSTMPTHEKAIKVADMYAELTERAKQRHSEEQGRLEDEAAAAIDTTRVRDIKTMAPLDKVEINKKRKVRARDLFDLSVCHSTGQRLDCKIEMVLRDDPDPNGNGGDVLICNVEEDSKWLLFQPIQLGSISSRRDQSQSDLVLMVTGAAGIGTKWTELLAVKAEESVAATEWLHMLGSNPLPPKVNQTPSWFGLPEAAKVEVTTAKSPHTSLNAAALANIPSDIDVPIGEPSVMSSRRQQQAAYPVPKSPEQQVKLSMGGGLQKRALPERLHHASPNEHRHLKTQHYSPASSVVVPVAQSRSPQIPSASKPLLGVTPQHGELVSRQGYSPQKFDSSSAPMIIPTLPSLEQIESKPELGEVQPMDRSIHGATSRPGSSFASKAPHRQEAISTKQSRTTKEDRAISPPKDDTSKQKSTKTSTPLTETIREQWASLSALTKRHRGSISVSSKTIPHAAHGPESDSVSRLPTTMEDVNPMRISDIEYDVPAPPVPKHHSPYASAAISTQQIANASNQPVVRQNRNMDYNEDDVGDASASSSSNDSDSDETDATSEISIDDYRSELKDEPTPLIGVGNGKIRQTQAHPSPLPNTLTAGTITLDPSDSASNGPYRKVPPPSSFPAHKKKRTVATVCSWSEKGIWELIRDEECSIVVSPGLVQAFTMTAAHSQPMTGADWELEEDEVPLPITPPLVEFELTPIVPLRKGTALDITIRSPPTPNSMIRTTSNVMFRSRTVQECEKLYRLINWARCNNPTYAQIARSRAREQSISFAVTVPETKTRSWFSFGSKQGGGYRAASKPSTSIADSAASGGTTASALSALRKFGIGSPFSLQRSSVVRKPGFHRSGPSLYSSSNSGSGSGASTPAPPSSAGFVPGPDGPSAPQTSAEAANGGGMVNNMKIRLFVRQGQKWEALGQCLLTVLPAAARTRDSAPGTPSLGSSTPPRIYPPTAMPQPRTQHFRLPSSGNTPHRIHGDGREKRILITAAKSKELVLLDEVLGESCFEKVMQTGIAVSVWKENNDIHEFGGVMTGRSRTYMIQFRTSMEAGWVFNMCGTYRYGHSG